MSEAAHAPIHRKRLGAALVKRIAWLWQFPAAAAGIAVVAMAWRYLLERVGPGAATIAVQVPLTALTAALAWRFALRHNRQWVRPARQLTQLIEDVRSGEAPIASLSEVNGPMKPLARAVQEMLHEVRREKQAKSRIQLEMGQQIKDRTEVLKRETNSWRTRAFRDPLTGLCNRRQLDELLPQIVEACNRDALALCLLAVDMDNFKKVNDTLGHDVGDALLRDVGALIKTNLREGDYGFRLGGDEFLILLPGSDLVCAQRLAERLTALVGQLAMTIKSEPKPGISIGFLCAKNLELVDPPDLLRRADAAMYEKKAERKSAKR